MDGAPENKERFARSVRAARNGLRLKEPEVGPLGSWFPGPIGENEETLSRLINLAIRDHVVARQTAYPNDPPWIDTEDPAVKRGSLQIERHLQILLRRLSRYSVPWYGYRYHAHMNWDNSLPALAGYFGAMLYNQNNVAGEGSPVTTALEIEVAADLCRMLGYTGGPGRPSPWGHITCGGSVANIEAMWAARNLKLYPFAVQAAIHHGDLPYRGFSIPVPGEEEPVKLIDLTAWQILNVAPATALAIPRRLKAETGWDEEQLKPIDQYSVQRCGLMNIAEEFERIHPGERQLISKLAYFAPVTAHYSMPKGATLLGLGVNNLIRIRIDENARMDLTELRSRLQERIDDREPVIAVIAVVGSTEEGAIDPLDELLEIREEVRQEGLDFSIHADAAWGGYFRSLLEGPRTGSDANQWLATRQVFKSSGEDLDPGAAFAFSQLTQGSVRGGWDLGGENKASHDDDFHEESEPPPTGADSDRQHEHMVFTPDMVFSPYTERQLARLGDVDSITVDPHKAGFAPYPAGALCYRNGEMAEMVSFRAPVVYHDPETPTVGLFGIEGSKPGAAAAGVWLSHRIIPPDRSGYGRILGRCIFNARRFIAAVATMDSPHFLVRTLQPLTEEERRVLALLSGIETNQRFWEHLRNHPDDAEIFRRTGSDLVVNAYALNLKDEDGEASTDATLANEFNRRVYKRLSLDVEGDLWPPVVITGSQYDPEVVGRQLVDRFRDDLGIESSPLKMDFLISTTANPWLTDADGGNVNMVPTVVGEMKAAIEEEATALRAEREAAKRRSSWG